MQQSAPNSAKLGIHVGESFRLKFYEASNTRPRKRSLNKRSRAFIQKPVFSIEELIAPMLKLPLFFLKPTFGVTNVYAIFAAYPPETCCAMFQDEVRERVREGAAFQLSPLPRVSPRV